MWSLFMYILQSDNCFLLLCIVSLYFVLCACALPCLILTYLCFTSPSCVSSLYLVTTLFILSTFSDDHTTGHSIPISKFTGLACFFTMQQLTPRRSSDHLRQESDLPHHARTDEYDYSSMELFLVQVKILSLIDSAGWW